MLEEVEGIAKDTPVVPNAASRFGNPAFRTFYDRVGEVWISLVVVLRPFVLLNVTDQISLNLGIDIVARKVPCPIRLAEGEYRGSEGVFRRDVGK